MKSERRIQLWSRVVEHARDNSVGMTDVCEAMIAETGVDRATVTVIVDASPRESLFATDNIAADLAELTLTLGEGPSVDAAAGGPVLVADLAAVDSLARWPMFAPAAVAAGARATFALPLQIGGIRLGVVDLYRAQPGRLTGQQLADGLMLADAACALLLDTAASRDWGAAGMHGVEEAAPPHPEVHQATGMLIVQLGVTAAVALVRLRAYAYATDRRLRDVAGDVVSRRLRFSPDPAADGGSEVASP